ncbi:MAG: Dcp1p-Dcp2p decapping enzyme complex alpha subunit [Vezdaea aestivalis]|nr:MAG: Dcp1p-Dcp2p decapping enzyme complex alpha subunit [Vezdaea aestivalis]
MGGSVPEIPGVKADEHMTRSFREEVAKLLNRQQKTFPGAQPVSFALRHILELQKEDYYVCEKSDGIRCLLYLTEDGHGGEISYLIDRKNDYYYVKDLHFPLPDDPSFQSFHRNTILDGELVYDTQPNGSKQMKYLVFDCLMLDNASLMHRTLDKRIAYVTQNIFKPYKTLYLKYQNEIQYLPFIIELKKMQFSYAIEMMFREVLPNLPHGNDGLIFTCRNAPYTFGTDQNILKWKPANENSIDFRLHLRFPSSAADDNDDSSSSSSSPPICDFNAIPTGELAVYNGSGAEPNSYFADLHLPPEEWEAMKALGKPLEWAVVECVQDEAGRWRFMRIRDDKKEANHKSTVESVLESIQDRVGEMDLIRAQMVIRDRWKQREREAKEREAKDREKARGEKVNGGV